MSYGVDILNMRITNLIKTTTLTSALAVLLFPYLICLFPSLIAVDYAYFGIGRSMTPTIQEGDLMAIMKVRSGDIELGDVLAVSFKKLMVIHRLVDIIEGDTTLIKLKGDGNEIPDSILYEDSQIIGKVVAVYPFRYLLTYGSIILLIAGTLLCISILRKSDIDLNDVLLCLIIPLIMGMLIGYRIRGG